MPFRAAARAARAAWDPLDDDPQRGCTPLGMPGAMMSPHPIEFLDGGDVITLRMEEWDGRADDSHDAGCGTPQSRPVQPSATRSVVGMKATSSSPPTTSIIPTWMNTAALRARRFTSSNVSL